MATILESANRGITKTELLTRANLTSGQLRQYLDILVEKRPILELADEGKRHMLTGRQKKAKDTCHFIPR